MALSRLQTTAQAFFAARDRLQELERAVQPMIDRQLAGSPDIAFAAAFKGHAETFAHAMLTAGPIRPVDESGFRRIFGKKLSPLRLAELEPRSAHEEATDRLVAYLDWVGQFEDQHIFSGPRPDPTPDFRGLTGQLVDVLGQLADLFFIPGDNGVAERARRAGYTMHACRSIIDERAPSRSQ